MLGLVTTKKGRAGERGRAARGASSEAATYVPLERLALSPQCGFASTEEGNLLTAAEQEAKLRLVAEIAREVWGAS